MFQKAFSEYPILTASSGEEGLKLLEQHKIYLILADHHMPKMSGVDFLERVQLVSPGTARAILSAYHDKKLVLEAKQRARIEEYFCKPWRREEIRPFIERVWQRYQEQEGIDGSLNTDRVLSPQPFQWDRLCDFLDRIGNRLEGRQAKRVCLNYVEPPLRRHVAPIHKPVPEALRLAEAGALKGNVETLERYLMSYLQEGSESEQIVQSILKWLPTRH